MPKKKTTKGKKKPQPIEAPPEEHHAPPPAVTIVEAEPVVEEQELTMDYWRSLAREALPETAGPWEESELGACFQQMVQLIKRHYTKMDQIARESGEKTLIFGLKMSVCRKVHPGEVKVDIAYSQNWKDNGKVIVPDPDQAELPLAVTKTSVKHPKDQATLEEEEENEQALRMKEIEEQQAWAKEQEKHHAAQREAEFDQKVREDMTEQQKENLKSREDQQLEASQEDDGPGPDDIPPDADLSGDEPLEL